MGDGRRGVGGTGSEKCVLGRELCGGSFPHKRRLVPPVLSFSYSGGTPVGEASPTGDIKTPQVKHLFKRDWEKNLKPKT